MTIQESAEAAIRQAEIFARHHQNDYRAGDKIPEGVMIATDLLSSDLSQFDVIPINNQGGYGLFVTTRAISAPNAGTYWCIEEATLAEIKQIPPYCGFVTSSQVEELKTIGQPAAAIKKAEEFSGHRQNNYIAGATVPEGVLIATDLLTLDTDQFGVIRISAQGGYGLFITTRAIQAPNAGTYWYIR